MSKDHKSAVSRESDKFMLRFPDKMRDLIARAAESNGRSMNSEIIARLAFTFDVGLDEPADQLALAARLAPAATLGKAVDLMPDPRLAHMLADMISEHIDKRFDVQMKPVKLTTTKKTATPASGRTTKIAEPGEPQPIVKAIPRRVKRTTPKPPAKPKG